VSKKDIPEENLSKVSENSNKEFSEKEEKTEEIKESEEVQKEIEAQKAEEVQKAIEAEKNKNKRTTDAYLESLLFLTKYYQKTITKESLVSGLLTQNMFMDLKLFIKASSRIGLITKISTRKLENISSLTLPKSIFS